MKGGCSSPQQPLQYLPPPALYFLPTQNSPQSLSAAGAPGQATAPTHPRLGSSPQPYAPCSGPRRVLQITSAHTVILLSLHALALVSTAGVTLQYSFLCSKVSTALWYAGTYVLQIKKKKKNQFIKMRLSQRTRPGWAEVGQVTQSPTVPGESGLEPAASRRSPHSTAEQQARRALGPQAAGGTLQQKPASWSAVGRDRTIFIESRSTFSV